MYWILVLAVCMSGSNGVENKKKRNERLIGQ